MPRYRGGVHQAGRKRRVPRVRADGLWAGYGRQVEDAVSGWLFPERFMVEQRGGLVSRQYRDGSLDMPPEY